MPKIYISSCVELKRGKHPDNSPWTLFKITDPQGMQYSTFEPKYLGMVGQEVDVKIEQKPSKKINPNTGKPYLNLYIVEPKLARPDRSDEFAKAIGDIFLQLEELRNDVKELQNKETTSF